MANEFRLHVYRWLLPCPSPPYRVFLTSGLLMTIPKVKSLILSFYANFSESLNWSALKALNLIFYDRNFHKILICK